MTYKEQFITELLRGLWDEVTVSIKLPDCPVDEHIINSRANFEAKAAYYNKTYDDDLYMKAVPAIRITSYTFFADVDEGKSAQNGLLTTIPERTKA